MRFTVNEYYGTEDPLDPEIFRVYFYWREGGIEHRRSFSIEQLEARIRECRAEREPTNQLELALTHLRRVNADQ
jgi:hypothetical protein